MLEDVMIAPSILSADFLDLGREVRSVATADLVHYDVMDGAFVPNLTYGPDVLRAVKGATDLPLDVHLMIADPDGRIEPYLDAGADMLCFHVEAARHAHRIVARIHERGARAAVALNPGTPVSALDAIVDDLDMVLLMSVDPGYGGQSFIEGTYDKLRALGRLCARHGVHPLVEVDGGIKASNAEEVVAAGANVLVAGSAVFAREDRTAAVAEIREAGRRGLMGRA